MKSFFFYIHDDLSGDKSYKKIGIGMTPYSVVRARQKFCSQKFSLNHLWFGHPGDIEFLEGYIKKKLRELSIKHLKGISATEIFKIDEESLINIVNLCIKKYKLNISKQKLSNPYSASKSSECPLNIPVERDSYNYLMEQLNSKKKSLPLKNNFEDLFTYDY